MEVCFPSEARRLGIDSFDRGIGIAGRLLVSDEALPAPRIDEARNRVVEQLSAHFARDHITLEELESRLERVYAARSLPAIDAELRGLPALVDSATTPAPVRVVAESDVPPSKTYFAVMSGVVRRGSWLVPKSINAVAIMGGVELDLRDATLGAGVTEIQALALMGGIVVTVPPTVRVECDGFAFMGGFEDQLKHPASSDPNAPVVRITGLAIMGGVEAKVREPGSRGRKGKKREQKRLEDSTSES